jgi:NTE family protein
VGLVLAGGAARGAYELGVLEHIVERVSADLGYDVPLDVLCGTSVGAINVCTLAALADEPRARVGRMVHVWSGLHVGEVLRPTTNGVFDLFRALVGRAPFLPDAALFDPAPLEQLLRRTVPFERIDAQLRAGRIAAVTVSATHVATGRTVVFVQRRRAQPAPWAPTANVVPRSVRLRPVHALASAAVPLLFPAVRIDGAYYCDGGLRQNIPLSPARRLGAEALIVVNPRFRRAPTTEPETDLHDERPPTAAMMLGKTLNALLLDRIDNDLDRLEKINDILGAGARCYGPAFVDAVNRELGYPPRKGLRRMTTVHIRASQDIASLSADYVRSPAFRVQGVLGRVMRQLADGAIREADLLSYLLIDGGFLGQLIELGRADAATHHDALCALFTAVREQAAE